MMVSPFFRPALAALPEAFCRNRDCILHFSGKQEAVIKGMIQMLPDFGSLGGEVLPLARLHDD